MAKNSLGLLFCVVLLSGCADNFSGNTYETASVGEVQNTDEGVIISMRTVEIDSNNSNIGAQVGSVAGGLLGAAAFGGGNGKIATAIGGAAVGGLVGHAIDTHRKEKGIEYTVRIVNNSGYTSWRKGSVITIVQGAQPPLSVNQKVHIIYSDKGRSRIVAAN